MRRRILGLCAVAGGLLRIANAFTQVVLSAPLLQVSYALTDILLLAGLAGFALQDQNRWLGRAGLAIAALGLLTIRVAAVTALSQSGYRAGATLALVGLSLFAADKLLRAGPSPAPVLWLAALAFGAGFVAEGVDAVAVVKRAAPG